MRRSIIFDLFNEPNENTHGEGKTVMVLLEGKDREEI